MVFFLPNFIFPVDIYIVRRCLKGKTATSPAFTHWALEIEGEFYQLLDNKGVYFSQQEFTPISGSRHHIGTTIKSHEMIRADGSF